MTSRAILSALLLAATVYSADVSVSWLPPDDATGVAGYRVHIGTASRQYDRVVDAGMATNAVIDAIGTNVNTYYGFTSYNKHGRDSEFCEDELVWDVEGYLTVTQPPQRPTFMERLRDWFKRLFNL